MKHKYENYPKPLIAWLLYTLHTYTVGVFHALTHTPIPALSSIASPADLTHTTAPRPVRTNTAALSVHYTTSSTALTRRKKDNAIYRSFFESKKNKTV